MCLAEDEDVKMARTIPPKRDAVAICCALVAIGIWFNLVGYGAAFEAQGHDAQTMSLGFYLGCIAAAGFFIAGFDFFSRHERTLSLFVPVFLMLFTFGYIISGNQTFLSLDVMRNVSGAMLGFCYIWLDVTLYIRLARLVGPSVSIMVIVAAQALEQILGSLLSLLVSGGAQVFICCTMPLVPLAALLVTPSRRKGIWESRPISGLAGRHFMMLLAVTGVAIVALGATSSVGLWGETRSDYVLELSVPPLARLGESFVSCLLMVACAWLTLRRSVERPISYRFQVPLLVLSCSIVLGLCVMAVFETIPSAISVILTGFEYYSHSLIWVMFTQAVLVLPQPPYRVGGVISLCYSATALVWLLVLGTNDVLVTATLFVLVCSLLTVSAIHPRLIYERTSAESTDEDEINEYSIEGEPLIPVERNSSAIVQTLHKRCEILGEEYALSPRELQVFELLAQGRSRAAICKKLVLSEGTIKTHVSHIFTKVGVRSHQQLLDIVYGDTEK